MLSKKQGVQVTENDLEQKGDKNLPSFIQAVAGPVVVVILLALRPEIKERMKLIPYEMCVGLTSTVVAVMMYVI